MQWLGVPRCDVGLVGTTESVTCPIVLMFVEGTRKWKITSTGKWVIVSDCQWNGKWMMVSDCQWNRKRVIGQGTDPFHWQSDTIIHFPFHWQSDTILSVFVEGTWKWKITFTGKWVIVSDCQWNGNGWWCVIISEMGNGWWWNGKWVMMTDCQWNRKWWWCVIVSDERNHFSLVLGSRLWQSHRINLLSYHTDVHISQPGNEW